MTDDLEILGHWKLIELSTITTSTTLHLQQIPSNKSAHQSCCSYAITRFQHWGVTCQTFFFNSLFIP